MPLLGLLLAQHATEFLLSVDADAMAHQVHHDVPESLGQVANDALGLDQVLVGGQDVEDVALGLGLVAKHVVSEVGVALEAVQELFRALVVQFDTHI